MLEYEMKLPLTADEYTLLLEQEDRHADTYVQTNYYYDNGNLDLNKQGITCRIREEADGSFTATVKKHDGAEVSEETSVIASGNDDTASFPFKDLRLYGSMRTHRTVVFDTEEFQVVYDINAYLGTVDYELEIEYAPGKRERAERYMKRAIEFLALFDDGTFKSTEQRNRPKSKSERFFERLGDLMCTSKDNAETVKSEGKEVKSECENKISTGYVPASASDAKHSDNSPEDSDDTARAYSTAYATECDMNECDRCGRNYACDTWLGELKNKRR